MILGDPWFLMLGAPVLLIALWRLTRKGLAVDGASRRALGDLPRTLRSRTTWVPGLLLFLAALFMVGALSRPLKGREESRITTEGIDIMLCVDASSSMTKSTIEAAPVVAIDPDAPPRADGTIPGRLLTNLEVVKAVVSDFVLAREHDRVGVLSFAAFPRTECPMTLDKPSAVEYIAQIEAVRAQSEEDGTAIGVAVAYAAAKLRDSDADSRIVVLLTDGENNQYSVEPMDAAAMCKELGVRVYTVGAGEGFGTRGGPRGMVMNTALLESIAETTGGRFFRARDVSALVDVYAEIDALERTERVDVRYTDYEDLYHWLVVPAMALLALEQLLRRTVYLEFAA